MWTNNRNKTQEMELALTVGTFPFLTSNPPHLASNLPILVEVVVTSMASCPPPITTCITNTTHEAFKHSKEITFIKERPYCNALGIKTKTKNKHTIRVFTYMIHDGGDGCRVNRSLCFESLDVIQRTGVKQLRENKNTVSKVRDQW